MKRLKSNEITKIDHVKMIGEIIYKIFKLGVKSYLSDYNEKSKIEREIKK